MKQTSGGMTLALLVRLTPGTTARPMPNSAGSAIKSRSFSHFSIKLRLALPNSVS